MKLSQLKEASYNPRTIDDESFEGLKYSLEEFGDISGIVFNTRTGNLVAGHQRRKGLLEKFGDLTVTKLKDDLGFIQTPDGSKYSVRFVDWDLKKEKAANLAANNPKIQGEFTPELKFIIDEINLDNPDLSRSLRIDVIDLPLSNSFDLLKDLEDNEFVQLINKSSKIFSMTFNFDNDLKADFENYLKINGKKKLSERIIEIVCRGEDA